MLSVTFLLTAIWFGLLLDEEFKVSRGDILMRLATAIVLGCFVGGWITFVCALAFGFGPATVQAVTAALLLICLFCWYHRRRNWLWFRSLFTLNRPFWTASGTFVALIVGFFAFGVWTDREGAIFFRGNFTDMAYHMGSVAAFVEQSHFPPFNPQAAHAKLSYHFMADFVASVLAQGGFSFFYSLKALMVLLAFSLGTITCRFFYSLLQSRTALVAACTLFFFGHIGVFHLVFGLLGYPVGNMPLALGSWRSIEDHLTFPFFNFLNVLVNYFEPQVPFLFGFPLALLVLMGLVRRFTFSEPIDRGSGFLVLAVALMPLMHVHSFLVLAPLLVLLLGQPWLRQALNAEAPLVPEYVQSPPPAPVSAPRAVRRALLNLQIRGFNCAMAGTLVCVFLVACLLVGLQFAFILSQPKLPGFSGFGVFTRLRNMPELPDFLHARQVWFWVRTAGMPFVLGLIAFSLPTNFRRPETPSDRRAQKALLALFGVTFAYFLVINFYRFTPNWGDSNKFFLYWNLILCLFAGRFLAQLWRKSWPCRVIAVFLLLIGAIVPTGVECAVWLSRDPIPLFSAGDRLTADWIRLNTDKDAVFLTANSYTHYVTALAGRRVINGAYTVETGYSDDSTTKRVALAYRTGDTSLIHSAGVTHVVVGPEERSAYWVNNALLARYHRLIFEQHCRGAHYCVYAVLPGAPATLAQAKAEETARGFIELSRLEPLKVEQFGTLRVDESFDQSPLRLADTTYASGLGTHAPSEICFVLDGDYVTFEAVVGIDASQKDSGGSAVFRVEVDGREIFNSGILTSNSTPRPVKVDITGAQIMTLWVSDAGDDNHFDHANWAGARLLRKPQAPPGAIP